MSFLYCFFFTSASFPYPMSTITALPPIISAIIDIKKDIFICVLTFTKRSK